ncbi:MAG: hypothetical protein QXW41_09430 [Fervidicoccaceae archaeon]
MPLSLIGRIAECVEGVIAAWGENSVEDVSLVCLTSDIISKGGFNMRGFIECIRKAYRSRAMRTPIYTGILVRKDCYIRGVGLKT